MPKPAPQPLPQWEDAAPGLRWMAAAAKPDLKASVFERSTDGLCRVLVHSGGGEPVRISREQLDTWKVTLAKAVRIADENMAKLLEDADVETEEVESAEVAHIESGPFTASLLFAPGFGDLLGKQIGFPLLVAIPARDHLFAIAEKDKAILEALGSKIVRLHKQSKHPVSLEIVRVSEKGMRSAGTFG